MKNKKEALGGVIIIVLLILVLVTYLTFYNYRKENKKEIPLDDNSKAINITCEDNGSNLASEYWTIRNCVFTDKLKDNNTITISANQLRYSTIDNNTFQDCQISVSTLRDSKIINNVFSTSTSSVQFYKLWIMEM